jgi:CheY-like chemotaxis protein
MLQTEILHGRSVLVVEDEYLIAADLYVSLMDAGAMVVGPVPTIADALSELQSRDDIDAAVVDLNLRGEDGCAVADALATRGIPFVFATAYSAVSVPTRHAHVPMCGKPMDLRAIANVLAVSLGPPLDAQEGVHP